MCKPICVAPGLFCLDIKRFSLFLLSLVAKQQINKQLIEKMFRNSVAQISKRSFTSSGARSYFAKAQFLGRIGADIEESVSANGKRYVRYPIAVQTNKDYPVNWFNIVAFSEKQVDFLTNYVKKG